MNQFEQIQSRVMAARTELTASAIKNASKKFEGLDKKMLRAAKNYTKQAAEIQANKDLTQAAKNERTQKKRDEIYEPARQAYLSAVQAAVEIFDDAISEIQAAGKPQSNTGSERVLNALLWKDELEGLKYDEFEEMYKNFADDVDFQRVCKSFVKRTQRGKETMRAETEIYNLIAKSSKKLHEMRSFVNAFQSLYVFGADTEILKKGSFAIGSQSGLSSTASWKCMENYNVPTAIIQSVGE